MYIKNLYIHHLKLEPVESKLTLSQLKEPTFVRDTLTFPAVTNASATFLFLPAMDATTRSPKPQFSRNVVTSTPVKNVVQNFHISCAPMQTMADFVLAAYL